METLELNKVTIPIGILVEVGHSNFQSRMLPWRKVGLKLNWVHKGILLLLVIVMNWRWICADGNRPIAPEERPDLLQAIVEMNKFSRE
jgi:hypothetical protein